MQIPVVLALCFAAAFGLPSLELFEHGEVPPVYCTDKNCKIDDECRCASGKSPLPSNEQTPQLISLTFDEAVNDDYNDNWRTTLLYNRTNPDGARIGATFFVPHEYTNYERVNELYNMGFEIAVHSITNNPLQSYWREASEELLEQEFAGQKRIISKFAKIPSEDIIGVRTPQLQLAGNYSIEAYIASGLTYDSSWPTLHDRPFFPYTLDFVSPQQCTLGNVCPTALFKKFWILPIVDLQGDDSECNNLASCKTSGNSVEIATWLLGEINRVRKYARTPITLIVNSNWFTTNEESFDGLVLALDNLRAYDDVFLVSQKQVVDWMKNPVPLSQFKTEVHERDSKCGSYMCPLKLNDEITERYMTSCAYCPERYPWLGNPEGDAIVST